MIQAFRRGGRLFYVGAGTSGRLGVLDASECPPTFRTPPEQVQGVIAGGQTALWRSVEGAEDDARAGGRAIALRGVGRRDVVLGIAASGRTPFVWGALGAARRRGAKTILLSFDPFLEIPKLQRPNLGHRAKRGPGSFDGFDTVEGRDGDQAHPEHPHHPGNGENGPGERQFDGGFECFERQTPRPRHAHGAGIVRG